MENGDHWLLIAEQDGEIVAVGTASITANGRTQPGRMGETGDVFIKESARGQRLSGRMRDVREETLRQHGVSHKEAAVFAANAETLELWTGRFWGASLRRPLQAPEPVPPASVRRVKDVDKDWAGIWRLAGVS